MLIIMNASNTSSSLILGLVGSSVIVSANVLPPISRRMLDDDYQIFEMDRRGNNSQPSCLRRVPKSIIEIVIHKFIGICTAI